MSDGTRRKLTMPPWHIPYLEKHRIYDLFHELARELAIQQPVDHVLFLKQILWQAAKFRDTARVIILSSPKVNGYEVAKQISQYTKQIVIGPKAVLACLNNPNDRNNVNPKTIAKCLNRLLRTKNCYQNGWILIDCVKTGQEARAVLEEGILPTHVVHLIPPFTPPLTELLYCHVHEGWPEYRRAIMGVRDAFKHCLTEVHLRQRNIEEIVEECLNLIKIKKGFGGPNQPRILILGPRGCGRKTQGNLLSERLNLIHVDFEYLLCQAWISQTELGEKLRSHKDKVCFQSNLLAKVVNQRILEDDCLKQGWVLTGFPYTVTDFKYLDCLHTPPNRERLIHRKVNVYTGSVTNLIEYPDYVLGKVLATHLKDEKDIINAELNYYCENYGALRSYCGETATVVNGDQPKRWVFECITAIVVRLAPACPPRNPCKPETDRELSDDELDSGLSDTSPLLTSYVSQI